VHTAIREARDTLVPDLAGRHGPLPPLLLGLTVVTGLVDAFSYLALGHVFVANMTGNVVFMAFSLAGAKGFSLTASVVSLLAFAAGALLGGRFAGHRTPAHRGRLLLATTALQVLLVLAALLADHLADRPSSGWGRVLSALAMFLGALAGAALVGHDHAGLSLLAAAALLAGVAAALTPLRRSEQPWTR
jgi:uncharacterized membrane protein YoaK (UPF0700 family)